MDSNETNGSEPTNAELEAQLDPSATEEDLALRILREGLVPAAQSIVHLAAYSASESVKLSAAKYVIDRNLGPIAKAGNNGDEDMWQTLIDTIMRQETGGN
jgi:hypothetical protein